MDYLKLWAKIEVEVNGLVFTVQILSNNIGIELRIKKFGVLVLKKGKVVLSEGEMMIDSEKIKEVEKSGYKYLSILE